MKFFHYTKPPTEKETAEELRKIADMIESRELVVIKTTTYQTVEFGQSRIDIGLELVSKYADD